MRGNVAYIEQYRADERPAPVGGGWAGSQPPAKVWLTYEDVAKRMGRSLAACYQLKRRGRLTAHYPYDAKPYFHVAEVDRVDALLKRMEMGNV